MQKKGPGKKHGKRSARVIHGNNVVIDYSILTEMLILVYSQSRNLFALIGTWRGVSPKISLHFFCTTTRMAFSFDYTKPVAWGLSAPKLSLYIFNSWTSSERIRPFSWAPPNPVCDAYHLSAWYGAAMPSCHKSFRKHIVRFLSFFWSLWISVSSSPSVTCTRNNPSKKRKLSPPWHHVWT